MAEQPMNKAKARRLAKEAEQLQRKVDRGYQQQRRALVNPRYIAPSRLEDIRRGVVQYLAESEGVA